MVRTAVDKQVGSPEFVSYTSGRTEFASSDGDRAELLFWQKCKKCHFILQLAARVP